MGGLPKVIYDLDGTMNELNDYVLEQLGQPLDLFKRYDLRENVHISRDVQNEILSMWTSPETFKKVPYSKGMEQAILMSESKCMDFKIHSMCLVPAVAEVKKDSLAGLGLSSGSIILETGFSKKMMECDIAVEDSLENLFNSNAKYKILRKRSYNRMENYPEYRGKLKVLEVDNLMEANSLVMELIMQEYKNGSF